MSTAKIEFTIGSMSFSGEASEQWLSDQLDKLLEKIENLPPVSARTASKKETGTEADSGGANDISSMTLVAFLQKCDATSNQNSKFLATALWAMSKQGKTTFGTKDVTGALTDAQQLKLNNPSQSLARVTKAGYVEKSSNGDFYITPEGKKYLKVAQ